MSVPSPASDRLTPLLTDCRERVEAALERWLPAASTVPEVLHAAMRYAVLSGGKRLRAVLVYASGSALGAEPVRLDAPACAVELIHAYSLVHDDLPAMDDDDLRRGRPSCHKAFDEATAILAGDALQSLAFHVLAEGAAGESVGSGDGAPGVGAGTRLAMVERLARASGSLGMAGGQAIDLAGEGKRLGLRELEQMHRRKTGALIEASVALGALGALEVGRDADRSEVVRRLEVYGRCVGLAFQIRDDVLDVEGDTQTLGKPQGSDAENEKSTYPALLGLAEAKRRAFAMHEAALDALAPLGPAADPLRWLSEFAVTRLS